MKRADFSASVADLHRLFRVREPELDASDFSGSWLRKESHELSAAYESAEHHGQVSPQRAIRA